MVCCVDARERTEIRCLFRCCFDRELIWYALCMSKHHHQTMMRRWFLLLGIGGGTDRVYCAVLGRMRITLLCVLLSCFAELGEARGKLFIGFRCPSFTEGNVSHSSSIFNTII